MLSAAKSRGSCPQCRLRLLNLFENGFAGLRTEAPRSSPRATYSSLRSLPLSRKSNVRLFSTTKRKLQDQQPTENPSKSSDIETFVRQAKHAFGDTLPKGYLNEEEYKLYERLYGAPLRVTRPEDVGIPTSNFVSEYEDVAYDSSKGVLLREGEDGILEEVTYETNTVVSLSKDASDTKGLASANIESSQELPSEAGITHVNAVAKSQREYEALLRLQKDFENAQLRAAEEEEIDEEPLEEEEEEEEDEGEPDARFEDRESRIHRYTKIGHWGTKPSTLNLPKAEFVTPINELLDRTDTKHIREAAERVFGGPGFPNSVATPEVRKSPEQKPVAMQAGQHKMSEIEADAYVATNLPGMYASVMSVLVEVRKRLGSEWIPKLISRGDGEGPRVLDVGAGGAGLAAWQQVLEAEWELMSEGGKKPNHGPPGKKTVVVGSPLLRQRISRFLQDTTFLPRLPDYIHSADNPDLLDAGDKPQHKKSFDIIIAPHLLLPLKEGFKRKALLDNLWEMLSPDGGVLIVMEKGHPRGFEAVADVRSRLLKEFIVSPTSDPQPTEIEMEARRVREKGMIIAPCTNHKECPMYLTPGVSSGRKDFCHFSQRYIRPPFFQKVLGASHRNHADINFSFIAIQRGTLPGMKPVPVPEQGADLTTRAFKGYEKAREQPNTLSLPRNILPPLKRRGHVTLDLCTPTGKIERWTVPKSFSKQAYHDARKTQWGDLWALGAKTRVERNIRLGRAGAVANDGGVRSRANTQSNKPRVIHLNADSRGIYSAQEKGKARGPAERRTKGGKKAKVANLLKELEEEGFQ
ncbi:mitochondrial small ribosomal subunit Rsm22-domain-containing protein [Daldinia caldariorum]|uniref:mitochondrial small ribosomal subunit Rsm22-domain-containing protein n=1 Tax=Daldinia caldariorum TaxID=326644 RepID=UPI002007AD65|nr:mitochondrial small ribosomal subunit Rsm22-domain-containing protein [Daldinia caldariorum]KAI1464579.1 mitochondrial small ribosomal subunit Rsm22-domain-containing protein [Daldinia caldariorum]